MRIQFIKHTQYVQHSFSFWIYLGRRQEATGNASFTGHDNAVLGQYSNASTSIVNGFNGIFHLMQTTFGGKGGGGRIVTACHGGTTVMSGAIINAWKGDECRGKIFRKNVMINENDQIDRHGSSSDRSSKPTRRRLVRPISSLVPTTHDFLFALVFSSHSSKASRI